MGKLTIEMFPPELIELNRQVTKHPKLVERLNNHPPNEFELRLAEICAYCDILLDGDYVKQDFVNIAKLCLEALEKKEKYPNIILTH